MPMWKELTGTIQQGHQIASGNASNSPYPAGSLEMQMPFFRAGGLDLGGFYLGTLNLSIAPLTFALENPEFTFRDVHWAPGFPSEDFSFSRCFVLHNDIWHDALIYYPHPETKIGHFQNASIMEIITMHLPQIGYGDQLAVKVDCDEVALENKRK